jgi:hypothetical protein
MKSGSEDELWFFCSRVITKQVFLAKKVGVLQGDEFEEVHWKSVYFALREVPRMFQIWACKQVMEVAGTNEMQARYTPG